MLIWQGLTLSAQSFSMEEAIDYALANHNDIKRNLLDQSDAEWQVKEYWARGLPQLKGNIGYQYFFEIPTTILPDEFSLPGQSNEVQFGTINNLTAGLSATALVFDGGFIVGLKAQRAFKELIESQIGQTERDIRVNVTKAYLNVIALDESLRIVQENISFISNTRDETQALYENGFAEQLDVDRLNLTIQNLQADRDNLVQVIESTKFVLKFQMGYPLANPIDLNDNLDKILVSRPVDDEINVDDFAFDNRVELGLLDQGIGLTEINIRSIKAQYLPTLTASIDYNQSLQTNTLFGKGNKWFPTGIAGLNLAIPIYDAGDKKAKIERASIDREELLLQRNDVERLIQMEIQTSKISVENAKRSLKQRQASQALAEKIYNTTLIKYKEGVGSSLEINQAEIDMLSAQRNYIDTLFDYLMARTDLERALGKL
jgi:outer membrane protein TolC